MIDWRALFDEIHVEWKDRGPNSSRSNINLSCPWCGDDPSMHLAVALNGKGYYCYRNPGQHSGQRLETLLVKLGVGRTEAQSLLAHHSGKDSPEAARPRPLPQVGELARAWGRFEPAADYPFCLEYLEARGFDDPLLLAARYDLRYARLGKWSGRLLIPYYEKGDLVSWTGRALSPRSEPKYLMRADTGSGLLYVPMVADYDCGVIVEGPLDALKIAAAGRRDRFHAAALCGKALNPAKLLRIKEFLLRCTHTFLALDADVPLIQIMQTMAVVRPLVPSRHIERLRLPEGRKDPGELSFVEIKEWLSHIPA